MSIAVGNRMNYGSFKNGTSDWWLIHNAGKGSFTVKSGESITFSAYSVRDTFLEHDPMHDPTITVITFTIAQS